MSNAKTPKTLDSEQQQKLLTALLRKGAATKTASKGIRNYLMACLMLDAGLRVGELVKLKIAHLYFNDVPVQTLCLTPSVTKNHRERTIPISSRLAESLRTYFSTWLIFDLNNDADFVFRSGDNVCPMTTRQVENIVEI